MNRSKGNGYTSENIIVVLARMLFGCGLALLVLLGLAFVAGILAYFGIYVSG